MTNPTPEQQQIADEWAQIRQMEVFKLLLAGPDDIEATATEKLIQAGNNVHEPERREIEERCREDIRKARELKLWMNNGEAIHEFLSGPTEPDDLTD